MARWISEFIGSLARVGRFWLAIPAIIAAWPSIENTLIKRNVLMGHSGIEDHHFYLAAAIATALIFAWKAASLVMTKVKLEKPWKRTLGQREYVRIPIKSMTGKDLPSISCRVEAIDSLDALEIGELDPPYILRSQQQERETRERKARKPKSYEVSRGAVSLREFDTKHFELITFDWPNNRFCIVHEMGEIPLPIGEYKLSISVVGGGGPVSHAILIKGAEREFRAMLEQNNTLGRILVRLRG